MHYCLSSLVRIKLDKMFIITFLVLLLGVLCCSSDLPTNFPKCYRDDPNLNECMLKAFIKLRDRARNGIHEIGLPPLSKIVTPLIIKQRLPMTSYVAITPNCTFEGLDNYNITNVEYDPEKMVISVAVEYETVILYGYAKINGMISSVTIGGEGSFHANMGPIKAKLDIKGRARKSNGIDFYDTKNVIVSIKIEDSNYYLDGFFDNNKILNNMANMALNLNSKMILETITPAFEKITEIGIRRFLERFTKQIPYDKILPLSH